MIQSVLERISREQKDRLNNSHVKFEREKPGFLDCIQSHALIVSGIRCCGKSAFIHQSIKNANLDYFYFNFEDIRLYEYKITDFAFLDNIIAASGLNVLFFDEIQIVKGWELYVKQKLDRGYKVIISGSNTNLFSSEFGSKLENQYVHKELFPLSYREFVLFKKVDVSAESFYDYMQTGGFQEVIESNKYEMLSHLIDDIVNRDIIVRNGIKDAMSAKRLISFLLSNTAQSIVPSKLRDIAGVKSPSTILDYFSYFESLYLIHLVPKFARSVKSQKLAPKKIYIGDTGLVKAGSVDFTDNSEQLFETVIFCELRRHGKELFYFSENSRECDFVEMNEGQVKQIIQVCWNLNDGNKEREVNGLLEALKYFAHRNGIIVTAIQKDTIQMDGYSIHIVPAHEYLSCSGYSLLM